MRQSCFTQNLQHHSILRDHANVIERCTQNSLPKSQDRQNMQKFSHQVI